MMIQPSTHKKSIKAPRVAPGGAIKEAVLGHLFLKSTPEDTYDVPSHTLERSRRKLERKGRMPESLPARIDTAAAAESMHRELQGSMGSQYKGYHPRISGGSALMGTDYLGGVPWARIESPSARSSLAGHEMGHLLDNTQGGASFRAGNDPSLTIQSEASATKEFLRRIPKKIHGRVTGLAHGFDTYHFNDLTSSQEKILNNLQRGLNPTPKHFNFLNDYVQSPAERAQQYRKKRPVSAASWPGPLERVQKETGIRARRLFTQEKEQARRTMAENRKTLSRNLAFLPGELHEPLKREAFDFIKRTRRSFGPEMGLGVARDIRRVLQEAGAVRKGLRVL